MDKLQPATRRTLGFAPQQWILALLIIAGLVLLGLPLLARSSKRNDREAVSEALMHVVAAREHYGLDHNLSKGTSVTLQQLLADGKYLKELPGSLLGRELRLGPVGGRIACHLEGVWFDPLPTKADASVAPQP